MAALQNTWEELPNPAKIVEHKGIGEGRRYFTEAFRDATASAGIPAHRRNIELLARGLINHVRLTDEVGDHVPEDVVPYSTLERNYQPREGTRRLPPSQAKGKYLEEPVLHHTIGTPLRPRMIKELEDFGVKEVSVHDNPPPFQAEMVRGMANLGADEDWMTSMYGSGLKASLLRHTQRGATSDTRGSSFVPSIAQSVDFGRDPQAVTHQPEPGYRVEGFDPVVPGREYKEGAAAGATLFKGDTVPGNAQGTGSKPLPPPPAVPAQLKATGIPP